jgi:hypothetical protein
MGSINDDHNIIGLSHLMKDDKVNPEINIDELERTIINGEKDIEIEEVDLVNQYKSELARLSHQFGVELSSDDGNISERIMHKSGGIGGANSNSWISQQSSKHDDPDNEDDGDNRDANTHDDHTEYSNTDRGSSYLNRESSQNRSGLGARESSFRYGGLGARESSFRNSGINLSRESSFRNNREYSQEGIRTSSLNDYRFETQSSRDYSNGGPRGGSRSDFNKEFMDPYAQNITQEQQKRQHLNHVFNNISSTNNVPMKNYDLMADREYEDKQMLLSAIDDLRDDLQQIGVDISRIKEVDANSSMAEIREVYNKLIYKNNSNNYSNFADELFLLGAQAAEFLFDGEKEWFGHKPDLTGWSNTVRGKLRRMRYTKTQIVRKIVDDYQIPPWLQIGFEVIPSAFTHSRHRKTAVRDSVVNNATYQNAIHDLNNIMS